MGLLFLAGMLALYAAAGTYARLAADRSYDRLLSGSALSITETLSIAEGRIQADIPYAALDMLSAAPEDRVFYRVIGPNRATVTGYDDLPSTSDGLLPQRHAETDLTRFFDAQYRGELVRFVLLGREIAQPGTTGWVWVQVGQTRRARDALAQELLIGALLPILLMTILALALVWFGIGSALKPLRTIGNELSERAPSDLHSITAPVPTEIGPLVDAINGFMRRLSDNIGTLRAFIADAAHQMRTPLAALIAQAQVAQEDDPAELRQSLDAMERNAAKLSRLVNQLLSDATVSHRSDIRRFELFDLLQTIRLAVRDSVPASEDSDVRLTTALSAAPFVGDGLMIGEAIKNLIHNALRHGHGDDGEVAIELSESAGAYVLRICDRGPGIEAADRSRVFERFARGSSSAPGAGLGLAIVRQAIRSHGGDIRLLDREGGGLNVELRLPIGPS
jgi:two-component system sensor histidine kinase TctE